MLRMLSWFNKATMQKPENIDQFKQNATVWPEQFVEIWQDIDFKLTTFVEFGQNSHSLNLNVAAGYPVIQSLDAEKLAVTLIHNSPDHENKDALAVWQRLLQLLNILQFLPNTFVSTQNGIDNGNYASLTWGSDQNDSVQPNAWDDVFTLADEEALPFIKELSKQSIDKPVVSYEHTDTNGKIISEAELAWPSRKTALLLDYQVDENKPGFDKIGWNVITIDSSMDVVLQLMGVQ